MSSKKSSQDHLPKPVPTPRSPGFTERRSRVVRAEAQIREQVNVEVARGELHATEAGVQEEADRRIADLLAGQTSGVLKQYEKLAPTSLSVRRDGIVDLVELAGIRESAQLQTLERLLQGADAPPSPGRPSTRARAIATFERGALEMGRPSVRGSVQEFLASNLLLDWAYGNPAEKQGCGTHERSVLATMQAMLDRHDPASAVVLNVDAIREFAKHHKDVGRYLAIDGTHTQAWLAQEKAYGEEHERLLNRGMGGAAFGTHGDHYWRGHTLLVLTCLKTTLPIAWVLIPASRPEAEHVVQLVDVLYSAWPDCPVEYICGDKGFDTTELHRDLEECYGIHLVTPLKGAKFESDLGVPTCSQHGPLKIKQPEYWTPAKWRRSREILPGERISNRKTGFRWVCTEEGCTSEGYTRFHEDPRRHGFLPHGGVHASRIDLRKALLIRRNAAESIFALLKHRGIAGRGVDTPRWTRTDRHMEWLVGTALLGITLRRSLHERGDYNALAREAFELKLLKPLGHNRRLMLAAAA